MLKELINILATDRSKMSGDLISPELVVTSPPPEPGGDYKVVSSDSDLREGSVLQKLPKAITDADVAIEARYLDTAKGNKLHCRYWRPKREENIKVFVMQTK